MADNNQRLEFQHHQGQIIIDNFSGQEIPLQTILDLEAIFMATFNDLPETWHYKLELKIFQYTEMTYVSGHYLMAMDNLKDFLISYLQAEDPIKLIMTFFNSSHEAIKKISDVIEQSKAELANQAASQSASDSKKKTISKADKKTADQVPTIQPEPELNDGLMLDKMFLNT